MVKRQGMSEHLTGHLWARGVLHRAGLYDRQADGVQRVTGRPAMSVREFVSLHAEEFGGSRTGSDVVITDNTSRRQV